MRRLKAAAIMLALAGGLATGTATSASAETPVGTAGCSTWQYKVKYMVSVEDENLNHKFYAYQGNIFNSRGYETETYYLGNVYKNGDEFRGSGWIPKRALDYLRCW